MKTLFSFATAMFLAGATPASVIGHAAAGEAGQYKPVYKVECQFVELSPDNRLEMQCKEVDGGGYHVNLAITDPSFRQFLGQTPRACTVSAAGTPNMKVDC